MRRNLITTAACVKIKDSFAFQITNAGSRLGGSISVCSRLDQTGKIVKALQLYENTTYVTVKKSCVDEPILQVGQKNSCLEQQPQLFCPQHSPNKDSVLPGEL